MKGEVSILITKGGTGVSLITQYLNQPVNVNTALAKMYIGSSVPNWNCEEAQALLDKIQAEGGLTITLYDQNNSSLGTAFLTTLSLPSADCGGAEAATLKYDPLLSSIQIAKTYYFTWQSGSASESYYMDLYPDEVISQNWQFTDISTFAAKGAFTREFRVPYSDRNQKIFDAIPIVSTDDRDDIFDSKIRARILVDDLPVIDGYIRVIRVVKQRNARFDIEISFYGDTPDLFTSIGQKKLREIVDLPNKNHTLDQAYIDDQPDTDILYSMIDRGTSNNLTNAELTTALSTDVLKQTPSLSWGYLFRQIIKDAGFTLDAEVLLSTLDTIWMPWMNATPWATDLNVLGFKSVLGTSRQYVGGQYFWDEDDRFDITGIYPLDPSGVNEWSEVYDSSGSYVISGDYAYYEVPYDGIYEFNLWATFEWEKPENSYALLCLLIERPNGSFFYAGDGAGNYISIPANSQGTKYLSGMAIGRRNLGGTYVPLEAGSKVYYCLNFQEFVGSLTTSPPWSRYVYAGNANNQQGTGWELRNIYGLGANTSFEVSMVANAPDNLQIDFVRDVVNMFNLAIVPDRTIPRKIRFEPMVNYLGSEGVEDWSGKLAIDKDIVIRTAADFAKQRLSFTYSAGADAASKLFKDIGQRIYGNYDVEGYTSSANETPYNFAQGDLKIQLITQSTPCNAFTGTDRVMPRFIDTTTNNYVAPNMRALFHAGDYTCTNGDTYRVLNHYSSVVAEFDDLDLNWAPEVPLHTIISNPYNNLFNLYWRSYLNEIYSKKARIMEAFFMLDTTDILSFSFAKQYWILDSYWRILNISDYKYGQSTLTKVVLIKILSLERDCTLLPTGSLPDGEVEWIDTNGDPSTGSQQCCERYGWAWSMNEERCYNNVIITDPDGGSSARSAFSSNEQTRKPSLSLTDRFIQGSDNTISGNSIMNSVIIGNNLNVESNSGSSLIIGSDHTIGKDNSFSGIIGQNALVKSKGFHIGGGKRAGVGADGMMQSGDIILGNSKVFNASAESIILTIGGDEIRSIEIPEDTQWMISITLNAADLSGLWIYSLYTAVIGNKGGILYASTPQQVVIDDAIGGQFDLVPVITLVAPYHKLLAKLMDLGSYAYPTPPLKIVGTIKYNQLR